MTMMKTRAFTLIELLLVVAIIALLISIVLPSLGKARNTARVAICSSNMRQLLIAEMNYGTEYKELIGALNWKRGKTNGDTPLSVIGAAESWLLVQGKQAKDIIQRRTGRNLPQVQNRFFNRNFWHLTAIDGGFLGDNTNPINPSSGCPSDDWVLRWQKNPDNYAALVGSNPEPSVVPTGSYEWYRPYWCSYQIAPVAFSPDRHIGTQFTLSQITTRHHLFNNGTTSPTIGQRRLSEINFPALKVFIFDIFDRHMQKRPIWHAYEVARQPLVFFDGSVRVKRTRDAQLGWNPDTAPANPNTVPQPTTYTYDPATGFPGYDWPTLSGNPTDTVKGYFRWTRDGLKGYDYIK